MKGKNFIKQKSEELMDYFQNPKQDLEIIKILLEKKADLNAEYSSGTELRGPVLHKACNNEVPNIEVIKFLIENNADINQQSFESKGSSDLTPLHFACSQKDPNEELIKLLLENKANPLLKDCGERHAIDIIAKDNNLLKVMFDNTPSLLKEAYKKHEFKLLDLLLENKVDINKAIDNFSPLHYVCSLAFHKPTDRTIMDVVEFMIENKADVNLNVKHCSKTQTPLYFAYLTYENIKLELIKLLIKNGADYNIQNQDNKTILDLAQDHKENLKDETDELPKLRHQNALAIIDLIVEKETEKYIRSIYNDKKPNFDIIQILRKGFELKQLDVKDFDKALIDGELLCTIIKFWQENKINDEFTCLKEDWNVLKLKGLYPPEAAEEIESLITGEIEENN